MTSVVSQCLDLGDVLSPHDMQEYRLYIGAIGVPAAPGPLAQERSSALTTTQTGQGTVSGVYAGGVHAFNGIPFAAPPFGSRRMRPPEPPPAWDGVHDCTRYGPTPPKNPYAPPFDKLLAEPAIPGEDCLNLNVWSPELGNAGLPVLVWIHGGSFTNGSGAVPQYDGTAFARDGVVCVTINYRLGAEGFGLLAGGVANTGLLDQVAALQWVHENIADFGGDPARSRSPARPSSPTKPHDSAQTSTANCQPQSIPASG